MTPLLPFLILYLPPGHTQFHVLAIAAGSPADAMAMAGAALKEQGMGEATLLGALTDDALEQMGMMMSQLKSLLPFG